MKTAKTSKLRTTPSPRLALLVEDDPVFQRFHPSPVPRHPHGGGPAASVAAQVASKPQSRGP